MRAKLAGATLALGAVLAFHSPMAGAEERHPISINEIRHDSTDRATRLTIDCTGPMAYTYYSPDPLTLVVDIPEADASQVAPRIAIGTKEVESVRVTSMARADGHNLARLEVKLASLVPYQIYSKDKSLNLVFERPGAAAEAKPWPADKDAKATATVEAAPPAAEAPRPAPEPAAEPAPPVESARSMARWMTTPSADGSDQGTPSSMTSAPARAIWRVATASRPATDRPRSHR